MDCLQAYVRAVRHQRVKGEFPPGRSLSIVASQADAALNLAASSQRGGDGTSLLTDLVLGACLGLDADVEG